MCTARKKPQGRSRTMTSTGWSSSWGAAASMVTPLTRSGMSMPESDADHADDRHHHADQRHQMAGKPGPGHEARALRGEVVGRVDHPTQQHDDETGPHNGRKRGRNGQHPTLRSIKHFHY